ncbi:polysaccharide deacetylase family protein [Aminobacter sp. AP02]|uniref:polysaccharide deacetylase family protein n=1 Tax=Aminobacter sp. AP02 TaxID=2135737 RepID=UPI000D6A9F60|nr:polysaccharide deacetylase family protein [Aminobacter sp. AP02]PWK68126.1 peptidoglycan/xylan/chitin deacetylase (PgdA/CDA1 family) [Aminobacter sp. AP02]
MRMLGRFLIGVGLAALVSSSASAALLEPRLHLKPSGESSPRVALTLDACGGKTDTRILSALVENKIPATIFVTGMWLKRNGEALAIMKAHPELFELENHGARHIPAVDTPRSIYGLKSAGSAEAVQAEVEAGALALTAHGGAAPTWFRGATAQYSPTSIALIRGLGFKIAGYSINGDGGSLLGAHETDRRVSAARDGDVIIAHINQPTHAAGGGLVKGLLKLKAKGYAFVRLNDVDDSGTDGTTN